MNKEGAKALKETWTVYSAAILKIFDPALTQSQAVELELLLGKVIDQVSDSTLVQIGSKAPVKRQADKALVGRES